MELFIFFVLVPTLIFAFAVFTNIYREHRHYKITLKPNCLLTRHPVVFLTGLRSLFYFRKYWNAYPEILAEHGYEVFTLHLPWRGAERRQKMREFLNQQKQSDKKYHFVCDEFTALEFKEYFATTPALKSLTLIQSQEFASEQKKKPSLLLNIAYQAHTWVHYGQALPTREDLGVQFPQGSSWLLNQMQEHAEQDFLS